MTAKFLVNLNLGRALAELAVIVIGILIALAADDWYASIQQRAQEIAWVTGIRDDLLADQSELERILGVTEQNERDIRALIASIDDPSIEIADPVEYLRLLKGAVITYFFRPTATTYTELTVGGRLSSISNRSLTRAVIEYHQNAQLTDDINAIIRQTRWFDFGAAQAEVLEPTLLAAMTEDWFRSANEWPPDDAGSPLDTLTQPVDLTRLRSSDEFRSALAQSLDLVFVQRGDLYRMLLECQEVLALAEAEVQRLAD